MSSARQILEINNDIPGFENYMERLIQIMSLSFEDEPISVAGLGPYKSDPKLWDMHSRVQLEAALTGAGRVFGIFIDEVEVSRLAGFAIWHKPGQGFLTDNAQIQYWLEFEKNLKPELATWWKEELGPKLSQLLSEALGEKKKNYFNLHMLGVHPDFQRQGLGGALVQHMLNQCDSDGVPTFLEVDNERNLPFYGKLGYEVKSQISIPSAGGDFTVRSLYREVHSH